MKVGRWRRERMGQNDSHTREVAVVLLLILFFGIYRIFGSAEPELMKTNEVNPDNVMIPMVNPAEKSPLESNEAAIAKQQGTSLRGGSSSEKLENKPEMPSADLAGKELSPPESSSDIIETNPQSHVAESFDDNKKEEAHRSHEDRVEPKQVEQKSPGESHEKMPDKHEEPSVAKDVQSEGLSSEQGAAEKSEQSSATKSEEPNGNQVTTDSSTTVLEDIVSQQQEETSKVITEENKADSEAEETQKAENNDDNDGDEEDDDDNDATVDDDSDDSELGAVKTNHVSNADDAKEDDLDGESKEINSNESDSEVKEEPENGDV